MTNHISWRTISSLLALTACGASAPGEGTDASAEVVGAEPLALECELACGDIDGSGNIGTTDGVRALRIAADLDAPSECERAAADVDGDGKVSVSDGVRILRAAADLEPLTCKPGWKLTFNDEFSGTELDSSKWNVCVGPTNGNQFYTEDSVEVSNGEVHLLGQERSWEGYEYTSGCIQTADSYNPNSPNHFQQIYGYFEMRARVPKGQGYWPAFWLLPPGQWMPEIDIMEILGDNTKKVYMTHHRKEGDKLASEGDSYKGPDFSEDFHTFAIDWSPEKLVWLVDGTPRFEVEDHIPSVPMYVIANLAIGGKWPGPPDDSTDFPQTMDIDYIRVYQRP